MTPHSLRLHSSGLLLWVSQSLDLPLTGPPILSASCSLSLPLTGPLLFWPPLCQPPTLSASHSASTLGAHSGPPTLWASYSFGLPLLASTPSASTLWASSLSASQSCLHFLGLYSFGLPLLTSTLSASTFLGVPLSWPPTLGLYSLGFYSLSLPPLLSHSLILHSQLPLFQPFSTTPPTLKRCNLSISYFTMEKPNMVQSPDETIEEPVSNTGLQCQS